MGRSDGSDGIVAQQGGNAVVHINLEPASRTERRVAGDSDSLALGEFDERILGKVGVVFNLER